tara:strand:+ start:527 stop:679 length:153 start_codon:yes stop_codon:yes gene_type:complete
MKWIMDLIEECFSKKWKKKYEDERAKYIQLKSWTEKLLLSNDELMKKIRN